MTVRKTTAAAFIVFATALLPNTAPDAAEPPSMTIHRATGPIVLDGVLDEADWRAAEPFGDFVFPWYESGEKEQTVVRMLWDDDFLYVSYVCEDAHIRADHWDTNAQTFKDDCVELFWNPAPSHGLHYYMFEMNCLGNMLAVCHNRRGLSIHRNKILPCHIAQTIEGTVNNDDDTDTRWTLEVAVRFSDYTVLTPDPTPVDGDMWRVALNRCGGMTNTQHSQWSPSGTPRHNFHWPFDFGMIYFSDEPVR